MVGALRVTHSARSKMSRRRLGFGGWATGVCLENPEHYAVLHGLSQGESCILEIHPTLLLKVVRLRLILLALLLLLMLLW